MAAGIPSEESVRKSTGKGWEEWFAWLDAAGAASRDHKGIVALLKGAVESTWWQQSVAVAYEKSRGLRRTHQKPKGYEISRTRTFDASADELFAAFTGSRDWLELPMEPRTAQPGKAVRFGRPDGTIVQVYLVPKSDIRCAVTVMHGGLPDAGVADEMKAFWAEALARLARSLAG